QINPDIKYICDPVMGDMKLGIFVTDQVVKCIVERLVPLADLLTPNQFELGLIAQTKTDSWPALQAAAAHVQALRDARLVVTGCNLADTPEGFLENIVFDRTAFTRLPSPCLPIVPVGTG